MIVSSLWAKRIHTCTPETRDPSKQWVTSEKSTSKNATTVGTFHLPRSFWDYFFWWDCSRIIIIEYVGKARTIIEAYVSLLDRLRTEL